MESPAERIVKKCGGHQKVADWLSVDVTRVFRWTYPRERGGTDGRIPHRHQQTLLNKAREEGVDLKAEDFFDESEAA